MSNDALTRLRSLVDTENVWFIKMILFASFSMWWEIEKKKGKIAGKLSSNWYSVTMSFDTIAMKFSVAFVLPQFNLDREISFFSRISGIMSTRHDNKSKKSNVNAFINILWKFWTLKVCFDIFVACIFAAFFCLQSLPSIIWHECVDIFQFNIWLSLEKVFHLNATEQREVFYVSNVTKWNEPKQKQLQTLNDVMWCIKDAHFIEAFICFFALKMQK